MFKRVIFFLVMLFAFSYAAVVSTNTNGTYTKTATYWSGLSKYWRMVEKAPFVLGLINSPNAYWGFLQTKRMYDDSLDVLSVWGYYTGHDLSGAIHDSIGTFGGFSGAMQNDLDSVKAYLNAQWTLPTRANSNNQPIANQRQDSIDSYVRLYKSDSIYVIISLPKKSIIHIYKNNSSGFHLVSAMTMISNSNLLNCFKYQNGSTYLLSDGNLYNISAGNQVLIATAVLGYSLDNQGIWLTNSSGQLSYLKNGVRTIVKTNALYAQSSFIVCPTDTTFLYTSKILNSTYNDSFSVTSVTSGGSVSWNWTKANDLYIDNNNDIWNKYIEINHGNYLKSITFAYNLFSYAAYNRIFDPANPETLTVYTQSDSTIYLYALNFKPYFKSVSPDSFAKITNQVFFRDTLRATDKNVNQKLTYLKIQDPIGISLNDTIITINKAIANGTYTFKFQVRDDFSLPLYDTLIYTFKVYTREIAPTIISTPILSITNQQQYVYQVQAIDSNGDNLTYSISGPSGMSINTTGKITWNTVSMPPQAIVISVSDGKIVTTQSYTLEIVNVAPVILSTYNDTTIKETDSLKLNVSVNDALPFSVTWYKDTTKIGQGLSCTMYTDFNSAGIYVIKVIVTDAALTSQKTFNLTVLDSNRAPIIQTKIDTTLTCTINNIVQLILKASDPDGDSLKYSIDTINLGSLGITVTNNDSLFTLRASKQITDTLTLLVSDGKVTVKTTVILIAKPSTSILPKYAKTYINHFEIANGEIKYGIAKTNTVKMIIYTLTGQAKILVNETKNPGDYFIRVKLTSGFYVCKYLMGDNTPKTTKIIIK